jgi:hypothetical protein
MKRIAALLATIVFMSLGWAQTPSPTGGKLSGLFFIDYFYKAGGDTTSAGSSSQFSAPMQQGMNAFNLRRLYLTYDHIFNENFVGQTILESTDKSLEPGGRFGFFVKTAFVEWKGALAQTDISFGLIPTPAWVWGISERVWAYRSVEKTIADFRGLGNATDFGMAIRGRFDAHGKYSYMLSVGNGTAQKPEADKNKKFYGEFLAKPMPELMLEAYGDYEYKGSNQETYTAKGVASYAMPKWSVGAEGIYQTQSNVTPGVTRNPFGISAFGSLLVPWETGQKIFARVDFYDPDLNNGTTGYTEVFATVGLDFAPQDNVHLIPNVWLNQFSAKSSTVVKKDADVVVRMTVAAYFR